MEEIIKSIQESLKAAGIAVGDGKEPISRKDLPSFRKIWREYIMPLKDQEVSLLRGRVNKITNVTDKYLTRISINGNESDVPIEVFEYTYNTLVSSRLGRIARVDEILEYSKSNFGSFSSSIVVAVFAQVVPFITRTDGSKGLKLLMK